MKDYIKILFAKLMTANYYNKNDYMKSCSQCKANDVHQSFGIDLLKDSHWTQYVWILIHAESTFTFLNAAGNFPTWTQLCFCPLLPLLPAPVCFPGAAQFMSKGACFYCVGVCRQTVPVLPIIPYYLACRKTFSMSKYIGCQMYAKNTRMHLGTFWNVNQHAFLCAAGDVLHRLQHWQNTDIWVLV